MHQKSSLYNTADNFGIVAKSFHWLMALLIIGMLCVGLYMVGLPNTPDKFKLYGLHKATGIVILFLVFLRFGWRQVNIDPPVPQTDKLPAKLYKLMELAAHASHKLIYLLMFLMPLSGWLMSSGVGFTVSVYGLFSMPNLIAPDKVLAGYLKLAHDYMAYTLIALLLAHIGAVLFHSLFLKDNVLRRMLPW